MEGMKNFGILWNLVQKAVYLSNDTNNTKNTNVLTNVINHDTKLFKKFISHLKLLGTKRVKWSKLCTDDPEIFDATVQNLDAMTNWRPGFVHSWNNKLKLLFYKTMSANIDKLMRFDTDKKLLPANQYLACWYIAKYMHNKKCMRY
jgi:hypothetical protein